MRAQIHTHADTHTYITHITHIAHIAHIHSHCTHIHTHIAQIHTHHTHTHITHTHIFGNCGDGNVNIYIYIDRYTHTIIYL